MGKFKVLIADDEVDIVEIYGIFLQDHYEILKAHDGLKAWKLFEEHEPIIVVTDLNMPGLNGLELTQRIKAHPKAATTRVIILTGTTTGTDLPPGFWNIGARADRLIEKPVSPDELLNEIRRQLILRAQAHTLPPGSGSYEVPKPPKGDAGLEST